jgi:hypothetical protein
MKHNRVPISVAANPVRGKGRYDTDKPKNVAVFPSPCEEGCPFFSVCADSCYGFDLWLKDMSATRIKTYLSH